MILALVEGQVWGARQAEALSGQRLLVVRPLALPATPRAVSLAELATALEPPAKRLVAADGLGAGPGELVLVAHGSRCRDLTVGETIPTKDVVIAILDGGHFQRRKAQGGSR